MEPAEEEQARLQTRDYISLSLSLSRSALLLLPTADYEPLQQQPPRDINEPRVGQMWELRVGWIQQTADVWPI